mmetsp:Transcript_17379/g.41876  ORF Transcript_17379/g.41876 Transcript_17379/m.41876 type:complete len:232 (+) Transcript_17379:756-1451(+)
MRRRTRGLSSCVTCLAPPCPTTLAPRCGTMRSFSGCWQTPRSAARAWCQWSCLGTTTTVPTGTTPTRGRTTLRCEAPWSSRRSMASARLTTKRSCCAGPTRRTRCTGCPPWDPSTFGIGPSTAEVSVSVLLLEANGEMSVCTHRTRRYTPFMSLMELPPTKKPSAGCLTLAVKGSTWSNRDTESKPPASKTSLCAEEPRRKEMRSSKKIPLGEPICSLLPLCVLRSIHPLS